MKANEMTSSALPTIKTVLKYAFASVALSGVVTFSPALGEVAGPGDLPLLLLLILGVMGLSAIALGLVFPFVVALRAIRESVVERAPAQALSVILVSYGTITIVFASLFVAMSSIGDYNDSINKLFFYQGVRDEGLLAEPPEFWKELRPVDTRAFSGISPRLWSGVDYPAEILDVGVQRLPDTILLQRASGRVEDIVEFRPEELGSVFLHCLHLSVVTITTLGYGTISPTAWYSRAAADVLVITGILLLVVALGLSLARPGWSRPAS